MALISSSPDVMMLILNASGFLKLMFDSRTGSNSDAASSILSA